MWKWTSNAKPAPALCACAAIIAGISGCQPGDGSDADESPASGGMCHKTSLANCGPGPWDPFGIALAFAWYGGQCTKEVLCTTEPVQTDISQGIVTDDYIQTHWTTSEGYDMEPNDSPAEATPFVVRANSGLRIKGTVNDASDSADFLAVSFDSTSYTAYLCRSPDECLQPWLESNEIYLELWDQNQLLIQTTNMMQGAGGHYISFLPSQGLQYFIAVRALDTGGQDFDYELVITD